MDLPTSITISVSVLTAGGIALKIFSESRKKSNGNGVSRREMDKAIVKLDGNIKEKFKEVVWQDVCGSNIKRIEQKIDLTTGHLSEKMDQSQEFMTETINRNQEVIMGVFRDLKREIKKNGKDH